ncbi:uncharacterized protein EV154DRAFT_515542 [Mucor mucedo]|uniref:uncharacterized protein n=1 Tax=Mucor mucedo TaxID=29922 RepID=UPI00221FC690|nr:uncharacterized protein EV154DRAFT_515542 [Mucor mucedo]KAI7889140.1 hypothetical protein EV154DRAFT_515542 [Mucor mucedo]
MQELTYIRAKREKTILFLCIDLKDTVDQLKTKLCQALDNKKSSDDIRILVDGKREGEYKVLEDVKFLDNSDIVYFVYLQGNGQWEPINVIEPEPADEDEIEEEEPQVIKKEKGKGRA